MKEWGTYAFIVASISFIVFTGLFFGTVRWWTDLLGRTIATVTGSISAILIVSTTRALGAPIPNYMAVRAVLYTVFAVSMLTAIGVFVWAQFIAPRMKGRFHHAERP